MNKPFVGNLIKQKVSYRDVNLLGHMGVITAVQSEELVKVRWNFTGVESVECLSNLMPRS